MEKPTQKDPKMDWGFYAMTPRIVRTKYKELSHTEKWLYTCLRDLCGKKGTCFRSLRSLKEETDISIASLSAMIPRLHAAGLIHAEKKRRSASGKEIWHISIVDIWQMNKDYCSENEQSNGEDVQNLNNDPEIVQSVNNDVQNLNKTPEDCSENERDCSNFRNRRRDSKNKDTEIYNEEEGTYRAESQGQECADAQPAPTVPYHPDFNADQSRIATDTEDHDNECMGRSSVSGDDVRHLHNTQGDSPETRRDTRQAASASDAGGNRLPESADGHADQVAGRDQQTRTTTGQPARVTSAGGSGYRTPPAVRASQQNLTGARSQQGARTQGKQNEKPQLTLMGQQVREAYEVIRATRLRMTPNNVKALNELGDMDGMDFASLKETIDLIEAQNLVKSKNIPIDVQELASEKGYWRFDKWYPVVLRNRQKQASAGTPKGDNNLADWVAESQQQQAQVSPEEAARLTEEARKQLAAVRQQIAANQAAQRQQQAVHYRVKGETYA